MTCPSLKVLPTLAIYYNQKVYFQTLAIFLPIFGEYWQFGFFYYLLAIFGLCDLATLVVIDLDGQLHFIDESNGFPIHFSITNFHSFILFVVQCYLKMNKAYEIQAQCLKLSLPNFCQNFQMHFSLDLVGGFYQDEFLMKVDYI